MATNRNILTSDNLETFSLVWLDINVNVIKENVAAQQELRSSINHIRTFETTEECEKYIRQSNQDRITFIVSDKFGQDIVPRIHDQPQVTSIYVFCCNRSTHEQWTSKYRKVKNVSNQLSDLISQIKGDRIRRKIEEPMSISVVERSSTDINGGFLHYQLFLQILTQMDSIPSEKEELLELCRQTYYGNPSELRIIEEFEKDYRKDNALWWYTRESFVYRTLNKAFRTHNDDFLILFRFLIRDIRDQISREQLSLPIRVYRGQLMYPEELIVLQNSVGSLISMNSFLSTSMNREYTLFCLNSGSDSNTECVLFEIEADPRLRNVKPFADITFHSQFPDEREVLFMAGCIFRLINMRKENTINIIELTLVSDEDHDLKELFTHVKKEIGTKNNFFTLANLLLRSGKLDVAEKCARRHLKELPDGHRYVPLCYDILGGILNERGEYDEAIPTLQKALKIYQQTYPSTSPVIATIYNTIGAAYQGKGDLNGALDAYEKAFNIDKQTYGEQHQRVADCLYNIGCVCYVDKKCEKALLCFQKSLAIREKILPSNHSDLSDSHNNIGKIYDDLNQFDLAMVHYEIALKISLKSLQPDHPYLAITYRNIAHIHEEKTDYRQAITYYEKAYLIYSKIHHATHPKVIEIRTDIDRVNALKSIEKHTDPIS